MSRLFAVAVLAAAASPAYAGVDPQILDAIKRVKPADYPSANNVTIVSDQTVAYQPDGQFTNTTHIARLVLTTSGKADASTQSLYYTKDAEKMEVLSAQVVKKDGSVVPVDPKSIQDTEQSGEMNIYDPQGRSVKVTFTGLGVGDVADITYKLTRLTPTRVGFFNDIFAFQSNDPILEAGYVVDGPASLPLTAEVYHRDRAPKVEETKAKVGDKLHYEWRVHNSAQLVPEMLMNATVELPLLIVTTDPSWQHFSQWWAKLTEPQLEATPEIKAKVKELTKDAKTDEDKIKALYNFVSQDIRYRGLGVGPRTGYTPRKAQETYTSRWGVCRDVSILLTSMLRDAGLEAYPVLTNVGDPVLSKIAYDGFNHAIVAMPQKGGGWRYLDPTAKNDTAMLPGREAEQNTLVSTSKGEPLTQIPALEPAANLGHAIATTTVNADGSMTSKVKLETKGMFDFALRGMAAAMSQDQQKEIIEQVIHHALPDAQLVSFEMTSALALLTPMEVKFEIKVPNAAPKTGDYRVLRTVVTSGSMGLVEMIMPFVGALPNRKFGLDAQLTFEYDQDETVTLPADVKVLALPNDAAAQNRVSQLAASCKKQDATTLACHRTFQLKSRFIDTASYKELRGAIATLGQVAKQPVIIAGGK